MVRDAFVQALQPRVGYFRERQAVLIEGTMDKKDSKDKKCIAIVAQAVSEVSCWERAMGATRPYIARYGTSSQRNHLAHQLLLDTLALLQPQTLPVLHEAWQQQDGLWVVRSTLRATICSAPAHGTTYGDVRNFDPPAAALFTLEYQLRRDADGTGWKADCTLADAVFASRESEAVVF